jgi:hypothetical protein
VASGTPGRVPRSLLEIPDSQVNACAPAFSISLRGRVVDRIEAMKVFVAALNNDRCL